MRKNYFIIFSIVLILALLVFKLYDNNLVKSFDGDEEILTVKSNLNVNASTNNILEVFLYTNNPKSVLNDYVEIECSLYNDENLISGTVLDSVIVNTLVYKSQNFYVHKMYIEPATLEMNFYLEECSLKTIDLDILLGNINITNYQNESENLDYKNIYVVGGNNLGFTSTLGIVLEIENISSSSIELKSIKIGNNYTSFSNAIILEDNISNSTDMTQLIEDYNPYNTSLGNNEIKINPGDSILVLVPVGYYDNCFLGNFNILINGELYIDNCSYLESYYLLEDYVGIISVNK